MTLENLLAKRKNAIAKRWFDLVIETYPADAAQFLKNQKDLFANPVGKNTFKGLEALVEELLNGMDDESIKSFLDPIIRMRAVQNFSPSQATGFIFFLKNVIRESLKKEKLEDRHKSGLLLLESKIDDLALIAFDIYMECKEKIYSIKANEEKNRTFSAFERAGLVSEIPKAEQEPEQPKFIVR